MKKIFIFPKLLLFCIPFVLLASCIKNDNGIAGDAKVMFHNMVPTGVAQDFYFNGVKYGSAVAFGSSSSYVTLPIADSQNGTIFNILSKRTLTAIVTDSLTQTLRLGKKYSLFYAKTSATDSVLRFYEDDVRTTDTTQAKVIFRNFGYNFSNRIWIRNEGNTINDTLSNGESTTYINLPINSTSKLYFNNLDSLSKVDTLTASTFAKGKIYTILIYGSATGVLQKRVVTNNIQ
ncbi:DUF4397 domain-containing protein [Pedobacter sp. AW1-32]|uniref:DUF4397 domain-containing protein n=1 Tax=Pedobacter sp. AW1-32 TaxID=3383026 RepID=UPI003FEDB68F